MQRRAKNSAEWQKNAAAPLDLCAYLCYNTMAFRRMYLGVAQLVARYLGVVEAARSSRVTQTNKSRIDLVSVLLLVYVGKT